MKHLTTEILGIYIDDNLNKKEIEYHLNICKKCFETYVSLKEVLFMQKTGKAIPEKIKHFAINKIKKQKYITSII